MIISLGERCSEGCSHCFVNSLPRSPIMSEETLDQTIDYLKRLKNLFVLISGGEFTEHPEFHRFISRIIKEAREPFGLPIMLLSNGSWFFDPDKKEQMIDLMKSETVQIVQVRTHKKFYPNYVRTMAASEQMQALSPKVSVFDDGIRIMPLGRARANHMDIVEHKMPGCGNIFLLAKQGVGKNWREIVLALEGLNRSCAPFTDCKGFIHAGETPYCEVLGHITDSDELIFENILKRCKPKNVCGLVKNWPADAAAMINS